jgi:hypothetical protein
MRMREIGMARVRGQLAWEFSVPPLLEAYDKALQGRVRPVVARPLASGPAE